jgi:hypothetical protein
VNNVAIVPYTGGLCPSTPSNSPSVNTRQSCPVSLMQYIASSSHDAAEDRLPGTASTASSSFSLTKWGDPGSLPKFSSRVQEILDNGRIVEEWDTFVAECAYHVLANGDMTDKTQYSDFGRAMVQRYSCVGNIDGQQLWVSLSSLLCCCRLFDYF